MGHSDYLVGYGKVGDFGLFRSAESLACTRGHLLVIRSPRGQEIGSILRPAIAEHALLLGGDRPGSILRAATAGDLELAARMQHRADGLFTEARRLAGAECPGLEFLDAEILLDGRVGILHYVGKVASDPRSLMDTLSSAFRLHVQLHDLALPGEPKETGAPTGCGAPGCGAGSCGSHGGCGSCSSGSCGSRPAPHHDHESLRPDELASIGIYQRTI